jgi:GTP cyclohydrolase I
MDKEKIERAVRDILEAIGEDPDREGLKETPKRVANMYEEIFAGISQSPEEHLKIFHEEGNEELVIVRDIPLYSMCEHHLLPFVGKAHIAYIPNNGKIIGISKLARIVNVYARRLQVQERLTAEVADFLYLKLGAKSVAVIVEAEHLCMTMRGVRAAGAKTETSALRGYARNDAKVRSEVMSLLNGGR